MIDQQQLERMLRTRPTADDAYRPVVADLLDTPPRPSLVLGEMHRRPSVAGRSFALGWTLVLIAIIVGLAIAVAVGTRPRPPLVDTSPERPDVAVPAAAPAFPTTESIALGERWVASWPSPIGRDSSFRGDLAAASVMTDGRLWTVEATTSSQSRMRVAAASRLFIVTIVLQLVDEGRLALDTPLSRHLPDWPGGEDVTIRTLLDGSSGIGSFGEPVEDLAVAVAADPVRDWSATDALRIARDRPIRFAPGTRHEAVDTEDALLVAVIESVTGKPFREAFAARLQGPMALRSTYMADQPIPMTAGHDDIRVGHWDIDGSGTLVETADLPVDVVAVLGPARGTASTIGDMARAMDALQTDPRYLSGDARALIDRPIEDGGVFGRGMCPCEGTRKLGVGVVGHAGAYTTLIVHVPSTRATIVVFANRTLADAEVEGFAHDLYVLAWPAIGRP